MEFSLTNSSLPQQCTILQETLTMSLPAQRRYRCNTLSHDSAATALQHGVIISSPILICVKATARLSPDRITTCSFIKHPIGCGCRSHQRDSQDLLYTPLACKSRISHRSTRLNGFNKSPLPPSATLAKSLLFVSRYALSKFFTQNLSLFRHRVAVTRM